MLSILARRRPIHNERHSWLTGPHNRTALALMTECLRHRGPDAAGYWEGPHISLGMRRLAIIDVATGQQPVFNEDGTVAVVLNGEI
jgi:asparagine synthase (glutamine-hydrolysing)